MSDTAPAPSVPTTAADAPGLDEQLPPSFLTEDDLPKSFLTASDLAPEGPSGAAAPGLVSRVASDIGHGIVEAPGQALRGVEQGLNGLSGSAFDAASWLNKHIIDLGQVNYDRHGSANPFNWSFGYTSGMPSTNDARIPDAAMPGPAGSVTGGLVEGAAQFATGMAFAGKFLRTFGVAAEGLSAAGGAAVRAGQSGASMALAFDPHEQRLSDLVQSYPALQNPVTEFLASHPDDGAAMARFRAGLEGLGIGAATEGVIAGVKALKAHYAGDSAAATEHADPTPEPVKAAPEASGTGNPENPIKLDEVDVTAEGPGKPGEGPEAEPAPTPEGEGQRAPGESLNKSPATLPPEENPGGALDGNPGTTASSAPQARKLVELTQDDLSSIRELQGNVTRASTVADADGVFRPLSGIRTDLIEHDGDLGNILDTLRVHYRDAMDRATGGTPQDGGTMQPVRTFADVRRDTERLADLIGDNPQTLIQRMSSMNGNLLHLDAETRLYGDFLATVGDRLGTLAKAVDNPVGDLAGFTNRGELLVAFAKQYELMGNVQAMYKGIQTNVARTLGAFRIGSKINPNLIASIANPDDLFAGGIANMERLARRINATGGDLAAVAKTTRPGFIARFLAGTNEYWINSVLSGPKTHAANMIGNSLSAAMMPAERMIAGALKVATPAGRDEFLEGGLHYVGMAMSLRDAVVMSARALKMGDGILDAAHNPIAEVGSPAISAGAIGASSGSMSGLIANGLGALARIIHQG